MNNKITHLITFILFLIILIISWYTPIICDSLTHDRIPYLGQFNFSIIWEGCVESYLTWNPRLGEMISIFITSSSPTIWAFLNPLVVILLILGLFVLATGQLPNLKNKLDCWSWLFILSVFIVAGVRFYLLIPMRACSMNYIWTGAIYIWFLTIYRVKRTESILLNVACLLYGIICGACNESSSVIMILIFTYWIIRNIAKKIITPKHLIYGLIGVTLGSIYIFTSPGLHARLDDFSAHQNPDPVYIVYIKNFLKLCYMNLKMLFGLHLTVFILLTVLLLKEKKRTYKIIKASKNNFIYIGHLLILCFLLSVCFTPVIAAPSTVQVISSFPLLIVIILLFRILYTHNIAIKLLHIGTFLIICAAFIYSVVLAIEFHSLGNQIKEREQLIYKSVSNGNYHPEVPQVKLIILNKQLKPLLFQNFNGANDPYWETTKVHIKRRFGTDNIIIKESPEQSK